MKKTVILLVCATLIGGCTPRSEAERFADNLLKKMTLREKLGQMSQFAPSTGVVTGPDGDPIDVYAMIKAGEIGSVLNLKTPQEIEHMQRIAVDSSRLGIPILFGHDIIHGCKIIFPINLASACSWNLDAARIVYFLRDDAVGGIDPDADAEGRTAASCDNKVINNFLS